MAVTKQGAWFGTDGASTIKNGIVNKVPAPIRSGYVKAEGMGVGPLGLALTGARMHSGDVSLGGAAAGLAAGGLAYNAIDKAAKKPMAALASKIPGKLLTRLPGWMGTAAKMAPALIGSGILASKAEQAADKHMPIWHRKPAPNTFPANMTPAQLDNLRAMVRGAASMAAANPTQN